MDIYTCCSWWAGTDRVDVSPWSSHPIGQAFKPFDGELFAGDREPYLAWLRDLYRSQRASFDELLAMPEATLVCTCLPGRVCHRHWLYEVLVKLGARPGGERPAVVSAYYPCGIVYCTGREETGMVHCLRHWAMIPHGLQEAMLSLYKPQQAFNGNNSREWMRCAIEASKYIQRLDD